MALLLLSLLRTAAAVPQDLECAWRRAALQHAKMLHPRMSEANAAFLLHSLNSSFFGNGGTNTSGCFPPAPPAPARGSMQLAPPSTAVTEAAAAAVSFHVAATGTAGCSDSGAGSRSTPFCSVVRGVAACRGHGSGRCAVLLGSGIHHLNDTIHLRPADSRLLIVGAAGGGSVISGATPIVSTWQKLKSLDSGLALWKTTVAHAPHTIDTLLVDGVRGVQARFPNADPEADKFPIGYVLKGGTWLGPKEMGEPKYIEYPDINRTSFRTLFKDFRGGVGGQCSHFSPPYSYWCAETTQGGGAHQSGQGGEYEVPSGITFTQAELPHSPYASVDGALITAWRPGHWSNWGFLVGNATTVAATAATSSSASQTLHFERGGFQGARGNRNGDEWFISNVVEELDAEREFYYNASTAELLYVSAEAKPPGTSSFQHALLKVLFNATGACEDDRSAPLLLCPSLCP